MTEPKDIGTRPQDGEARYREVFEYSPVSLWEDDWSAIKEILDDLVRSGADDLEAYLLDHPDILRKAYDAGRTVAVSQETVRIYRAESKEQIMRETKSANATPDDLKGFASQVATLHGGSGRHEYEMHDKGFDGSDIIVRLSTVIPPGSKDSWLRVFMSIEDLTERRIIEKRLHHLQDLEMVGQLAGGIAHDFNNLLAVIMGNAEFLLMDAARDQSSVESIIRSAEKGAELTQRMLAFSRRQHLAPRVLDLAALIKEMSESLHRTLGDDVEIASSVGPDLWPALADPGQLENVLMHLVINARDAMPGGGCLQIELANVSLDQANAEAQPEADAGEYVVLSVSDSGTGMSSDVRAHAFEPFFSTKGVGEGSGLGLSVVYGFAKQSGGHATIESEEGRGTTVRIYLPRAEAARADLPGRPAQEAPRGRGEVVLVVEDEPDMRRLTARMLSSLGYQVLEAGDGAAALDTAVAADPPVDLMLSDVLLPGGMNGVRLGRELTSRHPGIKLLFMSGYPGAELGENGVAAISPSKLLKKPFQTRDLAQKLRQALDEGEG